MSILGKLGQQQTDELGSELTRRLRATSVIDGICDTVRVAGERLATVLPRDEDGVNELADALVVIA